VRKPCVIFDLETNKEQAIAGDEHGAMPVGEAVGFPRDDNVVPYSGTPTHTDLLVPIFRHGELVYELPSIEASREHLRQQLSCAPPEILQLNDPVAYKIGLEKSLHELRSALIAQVKRNERADPRRSSK
jgi:Nicotinate phosphoribosyltransferase C-terminal domain